jgi:hypothetical protein
MTAKQRMSILLDRWPRACRAQGWDPQDRDRRLQVISQAVGRQVLSMNDLDNTGDIDHVYAHLGMFADKVALTVETLPAELITVTAGRDHQRRPNRILTADTPGFRRRLLWRIRKHAEPLGGDAYVLALPQCAHICAGLSALDDLPTESLHQLMMTLNVRRRARAAKPTEPAPDLAAVSENQPF